MTFFQLPKPVQAYAALMRLDKPVGWWLLLFPCWWALALASAPSSFPDSHLILLFLLGAIVMRSTGCIVNDLADRKFDAQVARTASRPLASGAIKPWQAIMLVFVLCAIGLWVVLVLPRLAMWLALASTPLIVIYPFMKRITWWPQAFLGLTFNWGVWVATAAATGTVTVEAALLYAACFFWTLGYDTIYACQDIADDIQAGVKSSARILGRHVKAGVALFYAAFLLLLVSAGVLAKIGIGFYVGVVAAALFVFYEWYKWNPQRTAHSAACFKASVQVGWIVFLAILAGKFF